LEHALTDELDGGFGCLRCLVHNQVLKVLQAEVRYAWASLLEVGFKLFAALTLTPNMINKLGEITGQRHQIVQAHFLRLCCLLMNQLALADLVGQICQIVLLCTRLEHELSETLLESLDLFEIIFETIIFLGDLVIFENRNHFNTDWVILSWSARRDGWPDWHILLSDASLVTNIVYLETLVNTVWLLFLHKFVQPLEDVVVKLLSIFLEPLSDLPV
jgi:hypothetical protein